MPESDPKTKRGVDALEALAYLIADEFVRESKRRVTDEMLSDPGLKDQYTEEKPKARVAGKG